MSPSRWTLLLAATALFTVTTAENQCCAKCLSQTDPKATTVTYDPIVYKQCSDAKGICCFGCDFVHGNPVFDGVTYNSDGDSEATANRRVTVSFREVSRVTYDFLVENQAKKSFVGNRSTEATKEGDSFVICPRGLGTIAFRGWGDDSCTQVTQEYTIEVTKVDSSASCDAGTVKPPDSSTPSTSSTPSSSKPASNVPVDAASSGTGKTGSNDVEHCSDTRGTKRTREDGTQFCECVGDWRNPPYCDQYSWTKTIITILGAIAAVLSIAFTVRAYIKSKKSEKERDADVDLDVVSEQEVESMRVSPSKRSMASNSVISTSNNNRSSMTPITASRETSL
ncbi:hypothetical protein Poli38472_014021 [Pythium oligandrum]|uniref:Uncharacterized protein n=1 Tax=Pythium oligandrum TaxID=41045 RepID=A0A8K1CP75_PYTOL|nr:hypothetical protein Poli38472_014021 [Pythium oligandrum]|eukprot:TMW66709.1 hypothetical protein Poli38472_014021 [Pythium oligandrum]